MKENGFLSALKSRFRRDTRFFASARAGFGVAPILYMLGLVGVGAGVLFSGYSQSLKSNINMTNSFAVKSDLDGAATTMAATSVLGATDTGILCPPQGGVDTTGSNCAAAPISLVDFYPSVNVTSTDPHLPSNYTNVSSSGTPVEAAIFAPAAGVKQIDPWGHYYIVCRWRSAANSTTSPAFEIISAGPDGIVQTPCGATVASGDDQILSMNAANAVNRSAVWQTSTTGTPNVYYGTVGHQLSIDELGNMSVPGNISTAGSYTSPTGNITLTTGTFSGNFQGGTLAATTGNFTSTLAAENGAFTIGAGGTFSAANGSFGVNNGGAFSASGGSFNVNASGDLVIGTSAFTVVAATGNTGIAGSVAIGSTLAVIGTTSIGTTAVTSGSSTPLLTVGKVTTGSPPTYPFTVDQYGSVTSSGTISAASFVGPLSGSVTGGTVSATSITDSGGMAVTGNYTSTSGNITLTGGTVTAANFVGNIAIGTGGGATITGVLPITNGGTGSTSASAALAALGVTSGGYLNTALLAMNMIPGQDIISGTITATQLNNTGVTAGVYNWGTVTSDGRVTFAQDVSLTSGSLTDGSGDSITVGTTGIIFTIASAQQGIWTTTGLGIGTTSPGSKLDVNGNLRIENAGLPAGTATPNQLQLMSGAASERWAVTTDGGTESGSNAGSNFVIKSYNDAGAALAVPLTINRATGAVTLTGGLTAASFSGSGSGLTGIGTGSLSGTIGTSNGGTGTSITFTQGSIVFAGASGIYTQDNANFFWDDTNHRLGIGTTSPQAALQIAGGEVQIGSSSLSCSTATAGALRYGTGSVTVCDGTHWDVIGGSSGGTLPSLMDGYVWIGNGSNVATGMQLSGDVTVADTGVTTIGKIQNIAVGTPTGTAGSGVVLATAPTITNLRISGTQSLTFGSDYNTTGTQNDVVLGSVSSVRYAGGSAATFTGIVAGASGQILYLHNASTAMLTLSNQSTASLAANRILTGTGSDLAMLTGSAATLQYDGTAQLWRVIGASSSGGVPAGTTGQVQFNSGSNTFAADSKMTWDNTNKQLVVGTGAATPVATTGTVAGFVVNIIPQAFTPPTVSSTDGIILSAGSAGQMAYYASNNTIGGLSSLYMSGGNIGIGTTAPETPLHVVSTSGGLYIDDYAGPSKFFMRRFNGTLGAPTAINNGDIIANFAGFGFGATAIPSNASGAIKVIATENFTDTNNGGSVAIFTIPNGSTGQYERMRIDNSGNVGIGTTTPSYLLDVNGTISATGGANYLSDVRHKKNVKDLTTGLDAVEKLRPVTFEWKAPKDKGMEGTQTGFIAQEVEKILPSTVMTEDNAEKTKHMKYNELIPVLTKAIQELKADNDNLRALVVKQGQAFDAYKAKHP